MTQEKNEINKFVKSVDGWLLENEGRLLYDLAKKCTGKGVIVEIGSWKGKSTIWLGKGSKSGHNIKVYAVDPHTGSSEHKKEFGKVWTFDEFKENIQKAGVDDIVRPMVMTSKEAAQKINEPVELIFIDGAHEFEFIKLDFELWFPKVVEGGIMAFHDTTWAHAPKKFVNEYIYKSRNFRNIKFIDSITFAEKVNKNTLIERIRNKYVHFLYRFAEFAFNLRLPKSIRKIGKKIMESIS